VADYTPSTTLTVPTGQTYTPSTTLTVSQATETYTIDAQVSLHVFEDYTISASLELTVGEKYTLSPTVSLTVFEDYTIGSQIQLKVGEAYSLPASVSLNVVNQYTLNSGILLYVGEKYTLSSGISLAVFEAYTLNSQVRLAVADGVYTLDSTVELTVKDLYTIAPWIYYLVAPSFLLPAQVTMYVGDSYIIDSQVTLQVASFYTLSPAIVLTVFEPFTLSPSIELTVGQPQVTYRLSGIVQFRAYEAFTLSGEVEVFVGIVPTGGTSQQGVGEVVALPEGQAVRWKLRVVVGSVDLSARVSGRVSIDRERNSAVVATFNIRPQDGLIDPYQWVNKPVTITYIELDSAGVTTTLVQLFQGLVDTPVYDTSSRLVEFTCTDDLQNTIRNLSHSQVESLTPLSSWSKHIYDDQVDSWEYLQQRLETYPYLVCLKPNGAMYSQQWLSKPLQWEFQSNTIADSTLSVALANSRDLVNSVDVTMAYRYDVYREAVFSLTWKDTNWYSGHDLVWLLSDIQMICDSVSNSNMVYVDNPYFNCIPSSRTLLINNNTVVFLNDGSELLALEFNGVISRRYTQSVENSIKVTMYSPNSIAQLGVLSEEVTGQLQVEYPDYVNETFHATETVTRWASTAGVGLSEGFESSETNLTDPLLFQGDGWVFYPKRPYSFTRYKKVNSLGISLNTLNHRPTDLSGTYDFSFNASANAKTAGEHFYDMDQFATVGGSAERLLLLNTLKAQAKTTLLESHRQNRVAFKTFLQPYLDRGDMVRVNTASLLASGLVNQLTHEFDIENGSAISTVTLAVSSVKAVGIPDSAPQVYRITSTLSINVRDIHGDGTGVRAAGPYVAQGLDYHKALPCHYHSGTLQDTWEGHITPADRTLTAGPNQFALILEDLLEQNTENATLNTILDSQVITIPQDELFLLSN